MSVKFSIVIPTYQNSQSLKKLLLSIQSISYDDDFEVLIIENGEFKTAFKEYLNFKPKIRSLAYHHLDKRSISFARNRGIDLAKYPYLLFLDDDVEVRKDILSGYAKAWRNYPSYTILGGGIIAKKSNLKKFNTEEKMMLNQYGWCFANQPIHTNDYHLQIGELLFSANLSFQKKTKLKFNENLGIPIAKNVVLGAEDYEICSRVLLNNGKICLLSNKKVIVDHNIDQKRLTKKYLSYRHTLAGLELLSMEKELKMRFGQKIQFSYPQIMFSNLKNLHRVLLNEYERKVFLSYLVNRNIFK